MREHIGLKKSNCLYGFTRTGDLVLIPILEECPDCKGTAKKEDGSDCPCGDGRIIFEHNEGVINAWLEKKFGSAIAEAATHLESILGSTQGLVEDLEAVDDRLDVRLGQRPEQSDQEH